MTNIEISLKEKMNTFFSTYKNDFQIYYIKKDGEDYQSCYLEMSDELKVSFASKYKEKLYKYIDMQIIDFDVVGTEDDCIEKLDSNNVGNMSKIKPLLNPIKSDKATEIDFNISEIWGYCVVLQNKDNKKLTIFRKYVNPKALIENTKLCFINGNVQLMNSEFISIDLKIDSIEYENISYVTNRFYFQQFFSFNEIYIKYVKDSLDALKNEDAIENFDEFSNRCLESGNLVKKLVKVINEDRLKWLKNNIVMASTVVDEYKLKVKFEGNKIVYNKNDCKVSDVMKLICGCCVKDAVDMQKYFANSVKGVS